MTEPSREATVIVRRLTDGHGGWEHRAFLWCPACEDVHQIGVASSDGRLNWNWNGSLTSPTFSPSIKVEGVQWDAASGFHKRSHSSRPGEATICHSHVEDGQWKFLSDCTHSLAGQSVPLVPVPSRIDIPGDEL